MEEEKMTFEKMVQDWLEIFNGDCDEEPKGILTECNEEEQSKE